MGYRIKTEKEFIEEFGVDWRIIRYDGGRVPWAKEMDYLFGYILSEEQYDVLCKDRDLQFEKKMGVFII